MDNKDLKSILQNALEDQMPVSQINLLPAVQTHLVARNKPLLQQGENMNKMRNRKLIFFAITIIALLAVTLITPQGRAFAQTLFRFFSPAKSESFPLSDEQLNQFDDSIPTPAPTFALSLETVSSPQNSEPIEATAVPLPTSSTVVDILKNCTDSSVMLSYNCQIAVAESQAGFDAYEFPTIPSGLSFLNAQSNTILQTISIHYGVVEGGGYLSLYQGIGGMPASSSVWGDVMANAIEQIRVGDYYGEFAQGQFVVYPGATSATWDANMSVLRLRWSDGNRWYSLEKQGNTAPIEYLDKDALITLAASLVYAPASDAITSIDNAYQMSIAEAEAAAGFDLLEPTIVPEGFEFAYARYDETNQTVYLFYSPKGQDKGIGGLLVIETPRSAANELAKCADCPPGMEEQVQVNGTSAYYLHGSLYTGSSDQPLATPVWRPDDPNYSLTWATSDLIITINFGSSEWYGGQITKDDLIKIAESMH